MIRQQVSWLAALALLATISGCGGGGGNGDPVPGVQETRPFDFTVTVAGTTSALEDVAFFQDQNLARPGVTIRSATQTLATPGASVTRQNALSSAGSGFSLAVHFDASASIDDNGRDPGGLRFDAADIAIAEVGSPARAPSTQTRIYAFRSTFANSFALIAGPFAASDGGARTSGIAAASAAGAQDNSPALTATFNIIGDGSGANGSLPSGQPHAMLLLTDGENNAEDPNVAPHTPCAGGEGGVQGCSSNIENVVSRANSRNVKIFVAGLGNVDTELAKFRTLAERTGGAFVKATRAEELGTQFRNVGALMAGGGGVVSGRTDPVAVNTGGNPFVNGWMRFRKVAGGCPGGAVTHDANFCKIQF